MDTLNNHQLYTSRRLVKPRDLIPGHRYPLVKLQKVKTQAGHMALLADINIGDEPCKLFMPKSYCDIMSETDIAEINASNLDLLYVGPHGLSFEYKVKEREV